MIIHGNILHTHIMNIDMLIFFISLVLIVITEATQINVNETVAALRKPRVNGRIVKLYSGNRPEPFLCPTEGFHLDPADCAVFYRCVRAANGRYTVFRFQCGPGTVYDPDTEVCIYPRSTKRSECGGSTSSIQYSHENEIDRTEQELPSPISTKKPVYIDQTILPSPYPWGTSKSRQNSMAPSSSVSTAYPWITTTSTSKIIASERTTSVTHRPISRNGDQCTTDGFMGDSENCRKFYRCVGNQRGGFIRYEFSCSESTIWDEDAQSCNHPWAVQRRRCGRGNSQDIELPSTTGQTKNNEPNTTTQQQTQVSYGTKVTQTQTQISNGTVIQTSSSSSKHASDAKQNQTQINYGSAVSQSQSQINYGNNGVQSQLQVDHSKQSSQTQTQAYESNTKTTTTSSQNAEQDYGFDTQSSTDGEESNGNEIECTDTGFMGDKNDCKKFYRCVDDGKGGYTKYKFSCGEGTVWDTKIEACNHAWAVKECGGKTPVNNTTQSAPSATETSKTTTQNYYTSSELSTAEDGDIPYGNPNQQTVSTTTTVQPNPITMPEKPEETVCITSGFIGDKNDCKKFYRCVDNGEGSYTKYEFKCGDGTVWDPDIEACNHAWAVKKCGGSSSENNINKVETTTTRATSTITTVSFIKTTTQTSDQNIDYDTGYGQQSNESPSSITTTTVQSQNGQSEENTECKTSGFTGDKNDCKKFYRCVDNGNGVFTRYEFSCGEGTVWDPKIDACNHVWAVEKCGADESADIHKETTPRPNSTISDEEIDTSNTPQKENEPEYLAQSTMSSSSSTKEPKMPDKSNECQMSGFMGDKDDCKKFYRCVDNGRGSYTRYEFSCSEGTVWDQSIEGCNHAWAVDNCGDKGNYSTQTQFETTSQVYSTSTSDNNDQEFDQPTTEKPNKPESEVCDKEGFVADRTDCKKFYRCVDNGRGGFIKYEFSCGEGTVWDPDINTCNHPSPGQSCETSVNESVSKEPDRENDETFTENVTSASTSSIQNSDNASSTEKPPISNASTVCKSEGFYGDPNNCKKFYRCVDNGKGGYTKYDFNCGDGTIWDQELQTCNHKSSKTDCSEVSSTEFQAQETENYTSTSSKPISTELLEANDGTKAPSTTSNDKCTTEGFFANSEDCKKFFRCVNNGKGEYTKYDFTCGEGTFWVQEIQTCDHDNNISNCRKQNETTAQLIDESQPTTVSSDTSSESVQSQKPNKEDDEYPIESSSESASLDKECSSEGFYANQKDCRRFYRCVDNGHGGYTKYEFVCGEGTAWDSDIQTCNHINDVKSCQDSDQEESQSKPVIQDEETPQETTIKTSTSGPATESTQLTNKDKCDQEGYFGNTEDCKKFYRCVNNGKGVLTKYDFTCGEGTIWDQDLTTCNHPQDVSNLSCKQSDGSASLTTSSSASTTGSSSQSTSNTDDSSNQGSSNCSQDNSSKKPINQNVTCTKAGYYADPNDCKKFYRCVDWDGDGKRFSVYHFDCGEGTIWDPALETCNHEDSVYPPRDCSGTQSQNENINSESTTTEEITSELTTQETTTSEQMTTQQTMTSAQTTTSEQTTAQTTTTGEETTTQQSTTGEQTTTQQSFTSEQSTTQQTTTSLQTTTQKATTSEQSTTQQTTTSKQTSTQQTTTSEQFTTQQTDSNQTTTQQSTSSEQTTTQETSNEQTTTQQSNPEQTTTQSSGNEETTTQQPSTTEQSTTEKNDQPTTTTEETTTQKSTTQHLSTDKDQTTEESISTTSQQTDENSTTESGQQTTESSSSSDKDCPQTDDDQNLFICPTSFKRHPKYCNLFYQCTEDDDNHDVKIAVFNCPNNTIYDESKTKCVQKDKADKKCDGEIAQRRRVKRLDATYKEPIVVTQEKLKCPAVGYFPFENEECSSVFLKCSTTKSGNLRGFVYQCPEGYVYWSVSKRCEAKSNVRFCKRSYNNWNERWEIPVERRNVAP